MNQTELNPVEVSEEWNEWVELSKCLKIPITADRLHDSLPMNSTESNPKEVSEEWDERVEIFKCLIPITADELHNSLPMNSTPVEVTEEWTSG